MLNPHVYASRVLLSLKPRRAGSRLYSLRVQSSVPKRSKIWESAEEAVKDVKSGDVLLSGGAFASAVAWLA
jgi:3-oxoacid CoA-transferase